MAAAVIPRRLAQRPVDVRGYPIPFTVPLVDGRPDFRASDPDRWLDCVRNRRCALCGEMLNPRRGGWFVGGPLCAGNHLFLDPAMHLDCAQYALQTCPFLAAPRGHFSDLERRPPPPGYAAVAVAAPERPDYFMLAHTTTWQLGQFRGTAMIRAAAWTEVRWWRHGKPLATRKEGLSDALLPRT